MAFVKWHYRDGVYVRSHFRHRAGGAPIEGQRPLLALVTHDRPRAHEPARLPPDAPLRPALRHYNTQTALHLREA